MVGGLATLGLVPLRPRQRIDLFALVVWFALYKLGIFALVTVQPRATRAIFLGALAIDLLLVFVLVLLTGGGESLFYLLFFPLVSVNAYYFGPWIAFVTALAQGRARGAQYHQRHRAERRDARRHRARPHGHRHGRGRRSRHRHPRPGQHPRRAHRGVPGVRALPPGALRGGVGQPPRGGAG